MFRVGNIKQGEEYNKRHPCVLVLGDRHRLTISSLRKATERRSGHQSRGQHLGKAARTPKGQSLLGSICDVPSFTSSASQMSQENKETKLYSNGTHNFEKKLKKTCVGGILCEK